MVVSIVKGEASAVEAALKHALKITEIGRRQEQVLRRRRQRPARRPKHEEAAKDAQIERPQRKVGELVFGIDVMREANKGGAFGGRICDSTTTPSPASAG